MSLSVDRPDSPAGPDASALVALLRDPALVADGAASVIAANDRFCELVGRSRAEIVGARPPYPWLAPEEIDAALARLARALDIRASSAELPAAPDGVTRRCTVVRPDGQRVAVESTLHRLGDAARTTGFLAVSRIAPPVPPETPSDPFRDATSDPITGVADRARGRTELEVRLADERVRRTRFGLLLLEADALDEIAVRHELPGVEAVMREVASRAVASLRPDDLVARAAGDAFLAILADIEEDEDVAIAGERVLTAVRSTPIVLPGGGELRVTASIGGTKAGDGRDHATLIAVAEQALGAAKERGGDRIVLGR